MANIDNLNFKVILDDKEFNDRVQKDIQAAKDLNIELTNLLNLKNKIAKSGISNKAAAAHKKAAKAALDEALSNERLAQARANSAAAQARARKATTDLAAAEERYARAAMATNRALNSQTRSLGKQKQVSSQLVSLAAKYVGIMGAARFIGSIVRVTGEFEMQKSALAAMIGELSKAEEIFGNLKQLALNSPFSFKELTSYAKQLTAFSVPAEELYDTTKMLADVSAGLGVDMGRIILAFGQVKAAAFLRGQEVRQFTEAGIPILNELAKQFEAVEDRAVSTAEVFDRISARQVPFEMVAQVFKDLTSEGGKFYKMQETLSETLRGKVMKLKDAYQIMLNEIGTSTSGILKGGTDMLTRWTQNWEKLGTVVLSVIAAFGTYKAVGAITWIGSQINGISRAIRLYQILATRINASTAAVRAFNLASKSNLIGFITAAVIGLVTAIGSGIRAATKFKRELKEMTDTEFINAENQVKGLEDLINQLSKARQGTKEYSDIVKQINRQHGEHFDNLIKESDAYDAIAAAAERAKESIEKKGIATARESGYRKIEEQFIKKTSKLKRENLALDIVGGYTKDGKAFGIDRKEAEDILGLIERTLDSYEDMNQLQKDLENHKVDFMKKVFMDYLGPDATEVWVTRQKGDLADYIDAYAKMVMQRRALDKSISERGDAEHFSQEERQTIAEIEKRYADERKEIEKNNSAEEARIKLVDLEEKKVRELIDAYKKLGREDMANYYEARLPKVTEGWRKTVEDAIIKAGFGEEDAAYGLWAKDSTVSVDYVDDIVKRYKELKDKIDTIPFDKKHQDRLKEEKELIEDIAKALGLNLEQLAKGNKKGTNPEIERLKNLVAELRKLQEQYEKLKALGVDDTSVQNLFEMLYPDMIAKHGKDFVLDLNYLERAKELIEKLAKLDPIDAEELLFGIGGDKFSQQIAKLKKQITAYKESAKAAGEYYNTLRKWASEDFNIDGGGITLDVSKVASDLNGKFREIELRVTKAKELFEQIDVDSEEEIAKVKEYFVKEFGVDAWNDFWTSYQSDGIAAIETLAGKEKGYEKKRAQERVNDLAQKYVKESYFNNNIELTDLGDKNFFQLRDIRKRLQDLLEKEPLKIPVEIENAFSKAGFNIAGLAGYGELDDNFFKQLEADSGVAVSEADRGIVRLVQSIQKAKLSTEDFGETIKKVIGGDLRNLTEEEAEAFMSMVKSYMSDVKDMMSSVASYAEAIGNEDLQGAVNGIAQSMDILGSIADRLAKGDWIGAIISGVTSLTSTILDAVSQQYALNDAIAETRNEIALLNSQKRINEGVESIFGTDDFGKFQNAYDEVTKAHADAIKDLEKQNQMFHGRIKDNWGVGGVAGSLAAGAGLGAAVGSIFPVIGTAIGAGVGALVGMIVGLVGNAATTANDYAKTLQHMADEIGADLIDESTGTFDVDTLKNIKKTYTDLDKEYKQMLDKLITNAEVFKNAVTEMATFMTDIFGQCADEMADSFVNSFKESGQAALEYGEIMSSLATDIAKSIVKSTILQNVFSEEDAKQAAVQLAQRNAAGAMQVVEEAMQAAQDLSPYIQQFLESLQPYFNMGEADGQSLADGIKGMTEDTANLLASYLNAIRADVSYARVIWERMDVTTQQIAVALTGFSAPSLMEYQAQIAANTYNTMLATQTILSKLDSVMTYTEGPAGIRVYS